MSLKYIKKESLQNNKPKVNNQYINNNKVKSISNIIKVINFECIIIIITQIRGNFTFDIFESNALYC